MPQFQPAELQGFCAAVLERLGVDEEGAELVARTLVDAEARGNASHGLTHLLLYSRRIREGQVSPSATPRIVSDSESTALIDADNGLGQVAANFAVEVATRKAASFGTGMSVIRNSTTFGAGAFYAERIAERDYIGVVLSNSGPIMAPWGGRAPILGNSPFAIGIPSGSFPPFILDMACSVTARGNIQLALEQGARLEEGLALDAAGEPTDDPEKALAGSVLPFGAYKGYGLALAIEILTGVLSGSQFTSQGMPSEHLVRPSGRSQTFLVIDIARIIPIDQFKERVDRTMEQIAESPSRDGYEIRIPGHSSNRKRRSSLEEGIGVHPLTFGRLADLGAELGLSPPAPLARS